MATPPHIVILSLHLHSTARLSGLPTNYLSHFLRLIKTLRLNTGYKKPSTDPVLQTDKSNPSGSPGHISLSSILILLSCLRLGQYGRRVWICKLEWTGSRQSRMVDFIDTVTKF